MTDEAVVVGGSGMVGQHILSTVLDHPGFRAVHAFARRELPTKSDKLSPILATDSSQWPTQFPVLADPAKTIFFSGLGTTRARAGSFEEAHKIDHDLNLALAKAAKEAGVRTYVLISAVGPNSKSMFPYVRTKGETEEHVRQLGFEHTVFVRPGLISGTRRESDSRPGEFVVRKIAAGAGWLSNGLKDFWAQDADVIARAAVTAGMQCQEGKVTEKVWIVSGNDIVKLGRSEWKV